MINTIEFGIYSNIAVLIMSRVMSERKSLGAPLCPCCGLDMDEWGHSFAGKVRIHGADYYCNNPLCCCEYDHRMDTFCSAADKASPERDE